MSLLRFLGLGKDDDRESEAGAVRRIARELERLPPETSKYLAAFAYVLARVAYADLEIDLHETAEMERRVNALASLSEAEATLVVEIAKAQNRALGGTENYVVTREFREISTKEQRFELLGCLYAVAAADGTVSTEEANEIATIGEELGFTRAEVNAVRAQYRDKLGVLRKP